MTTGEFDCHSKLNSHGYVLLRINHKDYYAHRYAWYIVTGKWPQHQIDHINGNRADNRWINLREATNQQNRYNCKKYKTNKSGYKGVHWDSRKRNWRTRIGVDGKQIHLGNFKTPEEAYEVYCEAARKYHKDFARLS